jgi:hypothetical protein
VGTAKVLSYEDIIEAQQKRDIREAEAIVVRGRRTSKRNKATPSQVIGKRSRSHEREELCGANSAAPRLESRPTELTVVELDAGPRSPYTINTISSSEAQLNKAESKQDSRIGRQSSILALDSGKVSGKPSRIPDCPS